MKPISHEYVFFADTWPEFMVGSQIINFFGRISNKKYFEIGGIFRNIFNATRYHASVLVSTFLIIHTHHPIQLIFCLFIYRGRAGIMTPFIYYHFLVLRYSSRRNPYTRNMFYELRKATEVIANNPSVPGIARKVLNGGIRLVSRLAPPTQPAQQ